MKLNISQLVQLKTSSTFKDVDRTMTLIADCLDGVRDAATKMVSRGNDADATTALMREEHASAISTLRAEVHRELAELASATSTQYAEVPELRKQCTHDTKKLQQQFIIDMEALREEFATGMGELRTECIQRVADAEAKAADAEARAAAAESKAADLVAKFQNRTCSEQRVRELMIHAGCVPEKVVDTDGPKASSKKATRRGGRAGKGKNYEVAEKGEDSQPEAQSGGSGTNYGVGKGVGTGTFSGAEPVPVNG